MYKTYSCIWESVTTMVAFLNYKTVTICCFWLVQDNIKDKMRSIPIEVSAEIGNKRQKVKNGLPQLTPILDSSGQSKKVTEVIHHPKTSMTTCF